jgi:hypothetical protein
MCACLPKAYLLPGKSVVLEVKFRLYSSKNENGIIYRIANNAHIIGIHHAVCKSYSKPFYNHIGGFFAYFFEKIL